MSVESRAHKLICSRSQCCFLHVCYAPPARRQEGVGGQVSRFAGEEEAAASKLRKHGKRMRCANISTAFSANGVLIAAASGSSIEVIDLQSSISFSPDGRQLAAADSDLSNPAIRLWNLETGNSRVLGRSMRQITSVAWLSNGKHLASGSWDETLRLWDAGQ